MVDKKNTMNVANLISGAFERQNKKDSADAVSMDKKMLTEAVRRKTMQETIERFVWKNLPVGLTQDLIERILYFRSKGALFELNGKPIFLPFALNSLEETGIDIYGRYKQIIPVLFTGSIESDDIKLLNGTRRFDVVYDESMLDHKNPAVILTDSSLSISQDNIPTNRVMEPFIEQLTDILVLINIDLINSAKVYTIIAADEAQKKSIEYEFQNLDRRILEGKRVNVVTSPTGLNELTGDRSSKDASRYFQSYQSFENLKKDILGIDNGGTFLKQEHMTDNEIDTNSNTGSLVLNNALRMRKEFCELANKVFGYNISVDLNHTHEEEIIAEKGSHTKQLEDGGE